MHADTTPRDAEQAPINRLIRTPSRLEECVACGHERIHAAGVEPRCPECGGSAHRSFVLFRSLTEVPR